MSVDERDDAPSDPSPRGGDGADGAGPALPRRGFWLDATLLLVVGAALRIAMVLNTNGGPRGNFGYDAAVYYNAADALIHGRLPYKDFLLLHPPGLMLVLTPFAELGRAIGDHAAFMVGNTVFSVLGGVSAVLVMAVARRMDMTRRAALVGGLFYAVWFGAIGSEISTRLEPLGSFAFLLGLLALTGPRGRRALVLGGVALGFAASVKIWWVVPLVVVLGWQYFSRPRRDALLATAGAVGALVVVNGPFFAFAPSAMWRMLVTDQVGRQNNLTSRGRRLGDLSSVNTIFPHIHHTREAAVVVVVALLAVAVVVAAWRHRPARIAVVVAVVDAAVLMIAPTYNQYYSGFVAAGAALVVGAAFEPVDERRRLHRAGPLLASVTLLATAVLTFVGVFVRPVPLVGRFPQGLAKPTEHATCIVADSPMALIELNALTRALDHNCPNWVDVTGHTFDDDRSTAPGADAHRTLNKVWQKAIRRYLTSGDAFLVIRAPTGLSKATKAYLATFPVLAHKGTVIVRRTAR